MPAKKYISKPLRAWQFDPNDTKLLDELSKLGIQYNKDNSTINYQGNDVSVDDGSYIAVNDDGIMNVYSESWFDSRYEEYSSTTTTTARKTS